MTPGAATTQQVRLYAAAADAAGCESTPTAAATIAELRTALAEQFGADFARVLAQCSLLVNGVRRDDGPLAPDAVIDVLPPFAGG